ncbi:pimeloyl-ACP methyl ester carboxylesterase [Sinobaca qinghaiensis]|uniref:Pimeloyl-ACP methyl ester carboxylesterase n=1 Tax=Sinobaca qinghaiensis TaxID=342944 RepID=A0A419V8U4_9BACL|nr:alpha/beta hydrolase [Sinobaca qinghaiensis]RKD76349.1 pimeloyl-ACP methyl ester carboxylesterase [Sinobaca qinghaiensis]
MDPLVLIPGSLCTEELWEHQAKHLSAGREVYIPSIAEHDSVTKTAEHILNSVPGTFSLAGLSLGGIIAMEIMKLQPERVDRLALLDTNPNPPTPEQIKGWNSQQQGIQDRQFDRIVEEQFIPAVLYEKEKNEPAQEITRKMAAEIGEDGFFQQLEANKGRPGFLEDLLDIQCPVLVMAGRQDALCNNQIHQLMAAHITGAKLVFIEECGHLSPIEQPQAVTAAMACWLQEECTIGGRYVCQ